MKQGHDMLIYLQLQNNSILYKLTDLAKSLSMYS